MFDFRIEPLGPVSEEFLQRGLNTFEQACAFVRGLPYGRNSSREYRLLVLIENKGTCSAKHALLAELALEQRKDIELVLGFFKMSGATTPAVREVLGKYGLRYLPELHTYLRFKGQRYDFTSLGNPIHPVLEFFLEKAITPDGVETFKTHYHKEYLQQWLEAEHLQQRFDLDSVWAVREECIAARSKA